MNIISILCLLIFFSLFVSLFIKGTDIFAPGRLFTMIWSFAIGLTEFKLSRLQYDWPLYGWILLLISIISVLLGIFVIYVINFNKKIYSIDYIRTLQKNYKLDTKSFIKILILLFLIYSISYIVIYSVVGYIPIFTRNPNDTRTKWSLFGFGLLIHLAPTIIYFIILFFVLIKKQYIKKIILFLIMLITLITFLLLLQRFGLLISIVLTVVFIYYGTHKFNYKTVIIALIILAGLSYSILSLRAGGLILEYLHYTSKMKYSIKYSIFTEPYMYVVMNLENFTYATSKIEEYTYGLYTFDFLFAITGLKHWLKEYIGLNDTPFLLSKNYNTYSMFFVFYRDFGILGLFFLSFLFGIIVSLLYYRMRKEPNINTISIYGIFVLVILFSFFNPMLSWLFFIFNIVIIYLVSYIINIRSLGRRG